MKKNSSHRKIVLVLPELENELSATGEWEVGQVGDQLQRGVVGRGWVSQQHFLISRQTGSQLQQCHRVGDSVSDVTAANPTWCYWLETEADGEPETDRVEEWDIGPLLARCWAASETAPQHQTSSGSCLLWWEVRTDIWAKMEGWANSARNPLSLGTKSRQLDRSQRIISQNRIRVISEISTLCISSNMFYIFSTLTKAHIF